MRIVRKVPDLIESFIDPAIRLLGDKHHGVLISGVKLCIELCQASDVALEQFRKVCDLFHFLIWEMHIFDCM